MIYTDEQMTAFGCKNVSVKTSNGCITFINIEGRTYIALKSKPDIAEMIYMKMKGEFVNDPVKVTISNSDLLEMKMLVEHVINIQNGGENGKLDERFDYQYTGSKENDDNHDHWMYETEEFKFGIGRCLHKNTGDHPKDSPLSVVLTDCNAVDGFHITNTECEEISEFLKKAEEI